MWIIEKYGLLGLVVLGFGVLILISEGLRRYFKLPSEFSRKFVHMSGGLLCLAFPWVVDSHWPILVIAIGMCALFFLTRRLRWLKGIHGTDRETWGSEFFPLSIYLAFLIAGDDTWIYVCAIITLAVADASAAMIGSHYGRFRYEVEDEPKSLEGSAVFAMCAFMAIHIPMLLMTDLPRANCVLIALLLSILLTQLEAISIKGWDNLIIPVAVCEILKRISTKPLEEIVYQNVSLVLMIICMALMIRKIRGFNFGGAITYILFAYACWSLGSYLWTIPVVMALAIHVAIWQFNLYDESMFNNIRVRFIARCVAVPFAVLLLANVLRVFDQYFLVFYCGMTVTLLISLLPSNLIDARGWRFTSVYMIIVLLSGTLLFSSVLWLMGLELQAIGVSAAIAVGVSFIEFFLTPKAKDTRPQSMWPIQRIGFVLFAVTIMFLVLQSGWIPMDFEPWSTVRHWLHSS